MTSDENSQLNEWLETYKNTTDEKVKKQLQNLIVVATMPLVKKIACSLARRSTDPVDDLIQVGSLGLIKAIDLYNSKYSTKFKSYASFLITGEIRHYLRDKASMIKAPREIQELAYRINSYMNDLADSDEEPTTEEVAMMMEVPVQKVNFALETDRRKSTISLDTIISQDDDDYALIDKIPDGDYQEYLSTYEKKAMLAKAIQQLDPKLRCVIELNYYEDLNQKEIAQKLGISQMQVSRRLKKALAEMYDIITKNQEYESE